MKALQYRYITLIHLVPHALPKSNLHNTLHPTKKRTNSDNSFELISIFQDQTIRQNGMRLVWKNLNSKFGSISRTELHYISWIVLYIWAINFDEICFRLNCFWFSLGHEKYKNTTKFDDNPHHI